MQRKAARIIVAVILIAAVGLLTAGAAMQLSAARIFDDMQARQVRSDPNATENIGQWKAMSARSESLKKAGRTVMSVFLAVYLAAAVPGLLPRAWAWPLAALVLAGVGVGVSWITSGQGFWMYYIELVPHAAGCVILALVGLVSQLVRDKSARRRSQAE